MIQMTHVEKSYRSIPVLTDVNFSIRRGEFVFLKGGSGSGKSTLLKILYRDIEDYGGDVLLNGQSLRSMSRYESRRITGTIFQTFELLDRKTVYENVALAGEVLGRSEQEIREETMSLLGKVGLSGKEDRFPHELSGGEQQRVAIARALLNKPLVLLADEPTGNLDPDNAENILELLKQFNEAEGITMLIVTHAEELTRRMAARTLYVRGGRVEE
jgi:cell division transport system ATP-binding protein